MSAILLTGDATDLLPVIPAGSVQCSITSPPYFGLRDYDLPGTLWPAITYRPMAGVPEISIVGCAPDCDHQWTAPTRAPLANGASGPNGRQKNVAASRAISSTGGDYCGRCGGWRGCLGLEPDPLMYIAHLVHIARLLWPALRDDGTLWLNLGDTYAAGGNGGGGHFMAGRSHAGWLHRADRRGYRGPPAGLKKKDLIGIPWRAALALQADGWYLRSDIIWSKTNCMPESVKDRPTQGHEYLFLLSKRRRYFYDGAAIAEPTVSGDPVVRGSVAAGKPQSGRRGAPAPATPVRTTRNARTVWPIAASQYQGPHFATFPELLVERCILASTRVGDVVLDPFGGSGTVGAVALKHNRDAILIDLQPAYQPLQAERTTGVQRLLPLEGV